MMQDTELDDCADLLAEGIGELKLTVTKAQQARLIDYVALLSRWNKTFNLTAVREPRQMVIKHLLDSLAVAKYLKGNRILDVGSGAGIPGIIFAVIQADTEFHLLDSNGKKTRFITQVASQLGLSNVSAIQSRVEKYQYPPKYTTIVCRAFASLVDWVHSCEHLLCEQDGQFLGMKGLVPMAELEQLSAETGITADPESHKVAYQPTVEKISVPFLDEARHVVILRRLPQT